MDDRSEWLLKLLAEEREDLLQLLDLNHTTLIAAFKKHLGQDDALYPSAVSAERQDLNPTSPSSPRVVIARSTNVSESSGKTITRLRSSNARKNKVLEHFFDMIDSNRNGEISLDEVRAALQKVGQSPAQARRLVTDMEALCMSDCRGMKRNISRDDWMRLVESHSHISGEICELAVLVQSRAVEDAVRHEKLSNSCILSFHSHFRLGWDLLCSICVIYVMILVPYWLGFDGENAPSIIIGTPRTAIGQTIDIIFLIDIVLNFRTSYQLYGREVRHWRKVALHYLRTWFLFDVVSSVPVSFLYDATSEADSLKLVKLGKALSMIKILRSAKAFHVLSMSVVGEFVENFMVEQGLQVIVKLLIISVALFFCCHWLACCMATFGSNIVEQVHDTGSVYIPFFYWALTTVTTVGYGDLVPKSDSERIIAMIAMCVGGSLYGLSSGIITSTVVAHDRAEVERSSKMDTVNNWLHRHPFPSALKRRLRHYFKVYLHHEANLTREELDIVENLTCDLRSEVARVLVPEEVREVPIFKCVPNSIIGFLVSTLQRVAFMPEDVVVRAGECGVAMFVIMEGHCLMTTSSNPKEINSIEVVAELFPGESFGEEIILNLEESYGYTVTAQEQSNFCTIAENLFMRFMGGLPQHLENMRDCYRQMKRREAAAPRQLRVVDSAIVAALSRHAL